MSNYKLILASTSPFRKQVLESTGLRFICEAPRVDEYQYTDPDPSQQALLRATEKAKSVAVHHPGYFTLGSDQTLSFEGQCLDKVKNQDEAKERLKMLSGKSHQLISAFAIFETSLDGIASLICKGYDIATLHFRQLTDHEINNYCKNFSEWKGTTGAYQYEGVGINLWTHIEGNHFTIVGIPIHKVLDQLRLLGISPLFEG